MDKVKISIVAPMKNESTNLDAFYERTLKVIKSIDIISSYEFVTINDGSTDSTLEKLLELNTKDSNVKIINLSRNFGKEVALSAGLDYATGDIAIPIDADLQDPPEVIPQLVEKWQEGYDVVYATRSSRAGETAFKKLTSFVFYRLIKILTGFKLPRDTGDFRLIDKKVLDALKEVRETHRFMKGLFTWVGFKQVGVMYKRDARLSGKTNWNYWKLFNLAIEGITSFSYFPLRLASYIGWIISLFSFVYIIFLVALWIFAGNKVEGYTSMMVAVLFMGGIQLVGLGIIGEYIGRTYNESKRRPLYLVRDKIGFDNN